MKKIYFISSLLLFSFGIFLTANNVLAEDESKISVPIQPTVQITSPKNLIENSVLVINSNKIPLNFITTGDPTKCWYDLGGTETFDLPGCNNTTIILDNGDYVLNLHVKNEAGEDFDSIPFFKVNFEQVIIKILSPTYDSILDTYTIDLQFTTKGNPTHCWYDLGGGTNYDISCQGGSITLPTTGVRTDTYGRRDYIINLFGTNGGEFDASQNGLDSTSLKIDKPVKTTNSSSGSIPQNTPTVAPAENGRVLGAEKFNFTLNTKIGSRGNEVTELQKRLIQDGYLKVTAPTGYFGTLTKKAVKDFQTANGISSVGKVGPLTRVILNK